MTTSVVFSPEHHGHLTPYMAALHASCITTDRVGPFLPPLTNEKLLAWWKERIAEANAGSRVMVLLLPEGVGAAAKPAGTDLRGIAMLRLVESETGSFRAAVDCVLVSRAYRKQGGARALMHALEREATKKGRTLLLVDAETGSAAEAAFRKLGYTEVGKIPAYSRVVPGGKKGETFFYKDLS